MALFADGNPSDPMDLTPYESSIYDTASAEGIDLVAKGTVAALEIGLELQSFLARTPGGNAYTLENVVLTDALRQWHILHTLAVTFRDAHHQQLNDRYKHKWTTYERLGGRAASLLYQIGLGLVHAPLPKPQTPLIGQTAGTQPGLTWYVRTSWVDRNGVESKASDVTAFNTSEGTALTVRSASGAPKAAEGWMVYVGQSDDQVTRQNAQRLAPGTTWIMPPAGLTAGAAPGAGQSPDTYLRRSTVLLRG